MESIVSLLYSATAAVQNPVQKSATDDLDYYNGCDMKTILKNIIEDLEELSLEISVKPKADDPSMNKPYNHLSVEFKLKEEFPYFFLNTSNEEAEDAKNGPKKGQLDKLMDRLEILQDSYKLLLDKVSKTMENLKALYDPKEYNIFITRKNSQKLDLLEKMSAIDKKAAEHDESENLTVNKWLLTPSEEQIRGENTAPPRKALHKEENGPKNAETSEVLKKEKRDVSVIPKKRKLSISQPEVPKRQNTNEYPKAVDDLMIIGPNGTTIQQKHYVGFETKGAPGATRFLCDIIFGDKVLATHSLTGNQSPAFRGRERPAKKQLDPLKTADITHLVCSKFNVSQQLVRSTITTKCADATKKLKRILSKTM